MRDKRFFLDTNILIYAYTNQDDRKGVIANSLITSNKAMISVQVVNEFCHTLRRKFPEQYARIELVLAELSILLPVAPLTLMTAKSAMYLSRQYALSYYDSLIVSSAAEAACQIVLSEDMQHDLSIDGRLRIQNPFLLT